jgi:hypothetical protein
MYAIWNALVREKVRFRLQDTGFGDKDGRLGGELMIVAVDILEPGKGLHVGVTFNPGPELLRRDTRSEVVRRIEVDEISFESWPVLTGEEWWVFNNDMDFAMAILKDV